MLCSYVSARARRRAIVRGCVGRILVIEDEPSPRRLIACALTGARHEVRAIAGRAEALRAITDFTPDLLLADWLLADETGYDVILAVREHLPGVRALFITGFPPERVRAQAQRVSPWPILEKPLDLDVLVAAVDTALAAVC